MNRNKYIARAEEIAPLSGAGADAAFAGFYDRHRRKLAGILIGLKAASRAIGGMRLSAGMMPPLQSVISDEIKGFCRLPYRTEDGVIPSCPGILGNWKGCPPNSPPVTDTAGLLSRARCFLILQFGGEGDHSLQGKLHIFMLRLAARLKAEGYKILGSYACGPCRICPAGCDEEGECRLPDKRLFALESCGFWVNRLCREASTFPVCGEGPREVRWIGDWGLPTQDTDAFRFVTGVLIGDAEHVLRPVF